MISQIVSKYHKLIYPYCHSPIGLVGAAIILCFAAFLSWWLFYGKNSSMKFRKTLIVLLSLLHLLVAVDWIYRVQAWGEHPVIILVSIACIDTALILRTKSYDKTVSSILSIIFLVAAEIFTFSFILCEVFPVFITIDW
ncbi:MAG: hypothetical protein JJE30_16420 [Desulfuromonadales bacterium]|nr:hypothetical protein [Desulfuromonadales bacterium]